MKAHALIAFLYNNRTEYGFTDKNNFVCNNNSYNYNPLSKFSVKRNFLII